MLRLENVPYISLGVVGVGFVIILIGILLLGNKQIHDIEEKMDDNSSSALGVEELFSYFLQEEEKKNSELRATLYHEKKATDKQKNEEWLIQEIVKQHNLDKSPEEIAKTLQIGVGEVQLILSLYNMR